MPCNCGKNKARATTLTPQQVRERQAAARAAQQQQQQQGRTQSFALRQSDGSTQTFGSKLEAEAENVRRGYTGRVVQI